jgi:hypothetical protein
VFLNGKPADKRNCWTQECNDNLIVPVRMSEQGVLEYESPPMTKSGPVPHEVRGESLDSLRLSENRVVDVVFADNGPGCILVLLKSADDVLACKPGNIRHDIGLMGPYEAGSSRFDYETRGMWPARGGLGWIEEAGTGSLNGAAVEYLFKSGKAPKKTCLLISQGTCIQRLGVLPISWDAESQKAWVGGKVHIVVEKGNVVIEELIKLFPSLFRLRVVNFIPCSQRRLDAQIRSNQSDSRELVQARRRLRRRREKRSQIHIGKLRLQEGNKFASKRGNQHTETRNVPEKNISS